MLYTPEKSELAAIIVCRRQKKTKRCEPGDYNIGTIARHDEDHITK